MSDQPIPAALAHLPPEWRRRLIAKSESLGIPLPELLKKPFSFFDELRKQEELELAKKLEQRLAVTNGACVWCGIRPVREYEICRDHGALQIYPKTVSACRHWCGYRTYENCLEEVYVLCNWHGPGWHPPAHGCGGQSLCELEGGVYPWALRPLSTSEQDIGNQFSIRFTNGPGGCPWCEVYPVFDLDADSDPDQFILRAVSACKHWWPPQITWPKDDGLYAADHWHGPHWHPSSAECTGPAGCPLEQEVHSWSLEHDRPEGSEEHP